VDDCACVLDAFRRVSVSVPSGRMICTVDDVQTIRATTQHSAMRAWDYEEDAQLILAVQKMGRRWMVIAATFPDRTEAMCRNRYARMSAPKRAGAKPRNRCNACGELKKGHSCRARNMVINSRDGLDAQQWDSATSVSVQTEQASQAPHASYEPALSWTSDAAAPSGAAAAPICEPAVSCTTMRMQEEHSSASEISIEEATLEPPQTPTSSMVQPAGRVMFALDDLLIEAERQVEHETRLASSPVWSADDASP